MTKDHIVPKFYLKNFRNENNKVDIFDIEEKKICSKGIKSITTIKNHNKFGNLSYDNNESYYSQNETMIANTVRKIIKNSLNINNYINKLNLSKFTIMQYTRGLKVEKIINDNITDENLEKIWLKTIVEDKHFEMYSNSSEFKNRILNNPKRYNREKQVDFIEKFQHSLKFKRLNLLINKSKNDFITSDEPVLISDIKNNIYSDGLLASNRIIYLPLSPKICLKWYDLYFNNINPKYFQNIEFEENGYLFDKVKFIKVKKGTVNNLNLLQCFNATKVIISNNSNYLESLINKNKHCFYD